MALAYLGSEQVEPNRPNREKALHWFTLAADRGNVRAQSALGHMWIAGARVEPKPDVEGWWVEALADTDKPDPVKTDPGEAGEPGELRSRH